MTTPVDLPAALGLDPDTDRMDVLDTLIALGYGDVPMPRIEELIRLNGGVLPERTRAQSAEEQSERLKRYWESRRQR
jgi:hypothetical protein